MSFGDHGRVSKESRKVNIEDAVKRFTLAEEGPIKKVVHDETIGLIVVNEHPELTKARARGWYLLRKCTVHVCNSRDMFADYRPVTGHEVVLEDNSHVDVVGFGTVKLQLDTRKVLTLENVFHIPEITKSLISVAKLSEMDFNVTFRSEKCVIDDGLEVVGKGYREDELYRLSLMGEIRAKKVVHKAKILLGARSDQKTQGWYLTSCSSEHVCYSRDMFVNYNPMTDLEVILGNDDHLDVAGIGTVVIRFDTDKILTLSNVLHIPKISNCYVSVAKLDDLGYFMNFRDGIGLITKSDEVIAKAYQMGYAVYCLRLKGDPPFMKVVDGNSGLSFIFGGGQSVIKQGGVVVQKCYKGDGLYDRQDTSIAAKVETRITIGLLKGDEHPELTKARARGWYLLPRCTVHVCNSRDMFVEYEPATRHEVVLEDDGSRVAVAGYGTVKLQLTTGKVLTLKIVHHIPAISKCCISVEFLKETGFSFSYNDEGCYVKKDDQIVGKAFIEDGMLRLGVIDERSGGNRA